MEKSCNFIALKVQEPWKSLQVISLKLKKKLLYRPAWHGKEQIWYHLWTKGEKDKIELTKLVLEFAYCRESMNIQQTGFSWKTVDFGILV